MQAPGHTAFHSPVGRNQDLTRLAADHALVVFDDGGLEPDGADSRRGGFWFDNGFRRAGRQWLGGWNGWRRSVVVRGQRIGSGRLRQGVYGVATQRVGGAVGSKGQDFILQFRGKLERVAVALEFALQQPVLLASGQRIFLAFKADDARIVAGRTGDSRSGQFHREPIIPVSAGETAGWKGGCRSQERAGQHSPADDHCGGQPSKGGGKTGPVFHTAVFASNHDRLRYRLRRFGTEQAFHQR